MTAFNPLPLMRILGSSNSVANKDVMLKIFTNGDTITRLHYEQFLLFAQCFQKLSVVDLSK